MLDKLFFTVSGHCARKIVRVRNPKSAASGIFFTLIPILMLVFVYSFLFLCFRILRILQSRWGGVVEMLYFALAENFREFV